MSGAHRPLLRAGQRVRGYPAFARDGRTPIEGVVVRDMMTDQVECVTIVAPREVTVLYPPELVDATTVLHVWGAFRTRPRWVGQITPTLLLVVLIEAVLWAFR